MVHLTLDLIAKSRNYLKKSRELSFPDYLMKLTHLHFSGKDIEDIVSIFSLFFDLFFIYFFFTSFTDVGILFAGWHLRVQKPLRPVLVWQSDITHTQSGLCLQPHPFVPAEQHHHSHREPGQPAAALQTVSNGPWRALRQISLGFLIWFFCAWAYVVFLLRLGIWVGTGLQWWRGWSTSANSRSFTWRISGWHRGRSCSLTPELSSHWPYDLLLPLYLTKIERKRWMILTLDLKAPNFATIFELIKVCHIIRYSNQETKGKTIFLWFQHKDVCGASFWT